MLPIAVLDPNLINLVFLSFIILGLGLILRNLKQPYVIAYILAGVLLGDHGFQIITNKALITSMGELGLILLLFFIGMEISLSNLIKNWKIAIFGTTLQISGSVLMIALIGQYFDWSMNRIIVLGFVISLSSSAVVIKILQDKKETGTAIGQHVISILLMQDILIVPMLIVTSYLGGQDPVLSEVIIQIAGGILIISGIIWLVKKKQIDLPYSRVIENDHELQVFVALVICFGFAVLTGLFGLSPALGAFVGGIFVAATPAEEWFHDSLHSFRVLFVAIFFISIGMLIDLTFLSDNWAIISLLIVAIYFSNHFINAAVLRYFGDDWKTSLYGGALLAQIGELSFVLVISASKANIISDFAYQMTIVVISLTLLISPFWIALTKRAVNKAT